MFIFYHLSNINRTEQSINETPWTTNLNTSMASTNSTTQHEKMAKYICVTLAMQQNTFIENENTHPINTTAKISLTKKRECNVINNAITQVESSSFVTEWSSALPQKSTLQVKKLSSMLDGNSTFSNCLMATKVARRLSWKTAASTCTGPVLLSTSQRQKLRDRQARCGTSVSLPNHSRNRISLNTAITAK